MFFFFFAYRSAEGDDEGELSVFELSLLVVLFFLKEEREKKNSSSSRVFFLSVVSERKKYELIR